MTMFINIVAVSAAVVLAVLGLVCVLAAARVASQERRDGIR